jgi:hypothetical protein
MGAMGVVVEGYVEAVGEEAGFEAGGAEDRLLRERHALEGEQFLGVDGLVDGGEISFEMGDFVEVFEADDGEGGGGKAVRAGVARGTGLAFGGARAGALSSWRLNGPVAVAWRRRTRFRPQIRDASMFDLRRPVETVSPIPLRSPNQYALLWRRLGDAPSDVWR